MSNKGGTGGGGSAWRGLGVDEFELGRRICSGLYIIMCPVSRRGGGVNTSTREQQLLTLRGN